MQEENFYEEEKWEEEIIEIEEDDTTLEDTSVFKESQPEPEPQPQAVINNSLTVEEAVRILATSTGLVEIHDCDKDFFSEVWIKARADHKIRPLYNEQTRTIYHQR